MGEGAYSLYTLHSTTTWNYQCDTTVLNPFRVKPTGLPQKEMHGQYPYVTQGNNDHHSTVSSL